MRGRGSVQCYGSGCVARPSCLCDYFCKKVYYLWLPPHRPWPRAQSVFQAHLHLTRWLRGLCASFQHWLSGPAEQRPMTQQPAQRTRFWGVGVG